jgi:Zn-dependent protease
VTTRTARAGRQTEETGGLLLFRLRGVPVLLAPSWWIGSVVITLLYPHFIGRYLPGISDPALIGLAATFAVLLGASVLAHELGHCIVAMKLGIPVRRLRLFLLGGLSEVARTPRRPGQEGWVAAAGPAVSLLLGLVFAAAILFTPGGPVRVIVVECAIANGAVGLFNLLPGLPLDGGRILRAGVWAVTGKRRFGTRAAVVGGAAVAIGLVVWALSGLIAGGDEVLLWLRLGVCVLTAWFVAIGASSELSAEQRHSWPDGMTLAEILRPVLQLPAESAVGDALIAAAGRGVVLVRPDGVAAGLLDEVAARQLAGHAPLAPAVDAAVPIRPDTVLFDSETGEDIIDRVKETAAFQFLVVDDEGKPAGVLRREDLNAALSARRMP